MGIEALFLILALLTGLIGVLHFVKAPKSRSNQYMGIFIIFFTVSIIHIFNVRFFFQTSFNPLILIPLNLVFFPTYFLMRYFSSFLSYQVFHPRLEKAFLILSFAELSTSLLPLGAWLYTNQFDLQLISFIFDIKRLFILLLIPAGVFFIWQLHKSTARFSSSTQEEILRIRWIKEIRILLLVLMAIVILPEVAYYFHFRSFYLFIIQGSGGAVIVVYMGIRNLNMQAVVSIQSAKETNLYNPEANKNFKRILYLFEEEKIYRKQDLRISDIADRISLSPNYVSRIINENANTGFNNYVNKYRIEEVLMKLQNHEHQLKSILALAQEAGFKSKSTFQKVFKNMMGKTPSEWIKETEKQ